jgi:RNA polymerase sigma-70 factor, ECF subfamily
MGRKESKHDKRLHRNSPGDATTEAMSEPVRNAIEGAARNAYGQLLGRLARQWRDIAAAEDALADALRAALEVWPNKGIPDEPLAWLATAATNHLLRGNRRKRVAERDDIVALIQQSVERLDDSILDDRLRLMLVCAHPAIDENIRAPLMLQTVLGLSAASIANSFMVAPTTMGQRLFRAKQKIRDSKIPFEFDDFATIDERLYSVLDAIYAVYSNAVAQSADVELMREAIHLSHLVATLRPLHAEALGLHALILFVDSRRSARIDSGGNFVPLGEQDVSQWNRSQILQAEQSLHTAAGLQNPGPFQLEAAINAAHCQRLFTATTPWQGISMLYALLNANWPTTSNQIGEAIALCETSKPQLAMNILDSIDAILVASYQPYWVARGHISCALQQWALAEQYFSRAIALTADSAVALHLERRKLDANSRQVSKEAHQLLETKKKNKNSG